MDTEESPPGEGTLWVKDHAGEHYLTLLRRLHDTLNPHTYLEVGCDAGESLALAKCASIGVDPSHRLKVESAIGLKPVCAIYRTTSDDFFAKYDPRQIVGAPIDMAFMDGMHLCEFLLRDFANTERHCRRNSVLILHDCLPVEWPMAERQHTRQPVRPHHIHSWAGDVWRTALLLKRRRPDLEVTAYTAPPTGLVCITNLDPRSTVLMDHYHDCVRQMMSQSLKELGIAKLFEELNAEPTATLRDRAAISSRFWL